MVATPNPQTSKLNAIAAVVSWLDEAGSYPADYVRFDSEKFEAVVTDINAQGACQESVLGCFAERKQAIQAIWTHREQQCFIIWWEPNGKAH